MLAARERAEHATGRSLTNHTYTQQVNYHEGIVYLLMPPINAVSSVQYWDGEEWQDMTENTDYTVYGLQEKYISVSTAYQILKISFSTSPYTSQDMNRLMMDLVSVMYDNRPNSEMEEAAIIKKMVKYKLWRAE